MGVEVRKYMEASCNPYTINTPNLSVHHTLVSQIAYCRKSVEYKKIFSWRQSPGNIWLFAVGKIRHRNGEKNLTVYHRKFLNINNVYLGEGVLIFLFLFLKMHRGIHETYYVRKSVNTRFSLEVEVQRNCSLL